MSGHRVGREDWNGNFLLSGRGDRNGEMGIGRLTACETVVWFFSEESELRTLLDMVKVL